MSRGPSLLMGNYNILYMHLYNNNKKTLYIHVVHEKNQQNPDRIAKRQQAQVVFFTIYLVVIQSIYNNDSFCINGQAIFHYVNEEIDCLQSLCRSIFVTIQTHLYNMYICMYIYYNRQKIYKNRQTKKLPTMQKVVTNFGLELQANILNNVYITYGQ